MIQDNDSIGTPLLNVQQAAEFLSVNVGTIRRWARSKKLTGINVGIRGDWRFTKDDLLAMVKPNHKEEAKSFPIVGIGASAGGLEAATTLLKTLPTNLGMAFVLVQHLDPTHESILVDLLSKATALPVEEVKNGTPVRPNHVYVIPHDKDMTIMHGLLKLTARSKGNNNIHMPIDRFLTSLAQSHKEKAIGVILSGTASDGTLGLKKIKREGGVTFAQDQSAKYQGMPNAAIASGSVDYVLSPGEIVKELMRMNDHTYIQKPQVLQAQQELPEDEDEIKKIFFMLYRNKGVDFSHYKEATVKRRISRQMHLHKIKSIKDYVEYLKLNCSEIESLYNDLLINVTSFFREPSAFQFLNNSVFPRIVKNRSLKEPIRVWVPGCATGEEVYSIAISLSEFLSENQQNIPIQLFGTDISKNAIEKARTGIYSQNDVVDVSPKRLSRYFEKTGGNYQISKSIRELCIFAPHNVFGDPPFSKLDLISCCNLLIYLDVSLQDKILRAFHYALKPGGFLMLGKSEAVSSSPELFSQIDKKYKMYSRKDTGARGVLGFDTFVQNPQKQGINDTTIINEIGIGSVDIQKQADMILLSHYTPASVVINNDLEITQFRGSTGEYLEPSQGKPSFNLIKMARGSLGFELRNAVSKVKKSNRPFKKENILVTQNDSTRHFTIEVLPLKTATTDAPHYLVLFEDTNGSPQGELLPSEQKVSLSKRGAKDRRIAELEREINQNHEDMRSIIEEQEATNEELQTASEEILSSNEELQSINEELETSKEELESTNEELTTVNEELQNRNEQLIEARDYAEAIIRTVQVPLLILDRDLRVKTTNRSFQQIFHVTEEESMGNFIYDLGNGQWNIPALLKLLNEILPQNNVFDNYEIEHTFPSIGHKIMLLNARKFYKDGDNILLAIEDITDRKDIDKQKDLFIGIASHELKTPITTMKGYAQILEKRLSQQEDSKDIYLIQNINKQTDRLTNLINDLLNTSKIQAGKLVMVKKKFDLNAVVSKTITDFQFLTETHQIIKEGELQQEVYGDQSRIEQVLTNLITNAIKYSPNAYKVVVRVGSDEKNATLSVQDFGFGIAKSDQAKVFERFYRTSDKEEMNVSGFGLGLYIAAEIIKGHSGKIWIESTTDKGSTFYFTLPMAKVGRKNE